MAQSDKTMASRDMVAGRLVVVSFRAMQAIDISLRHRAPSTPGSRARSSTDLRDIRRDLIARYPANATIYFGDLVLSAGIGWFAFSLAVSLPFSLGFVAAVFVSIVTLYRAAYFIHEIAHQRKALPGFEFVWNVLVGTPLLLPSFMIDPHADHHHLARYGTALDPEYEQVAGWGPWRRLASIAINGIAPLLLVIRFAVIAPLSWFVPPLRRLSIRRLSTLQTNPSYVRNETDGRSLRVYVQEVVCCAYAWCIIGLVANGTIPFRVIALWLTITSLALMWNQARTLYAHAYEGTGATMTLEEQVGDSATIDGGLWTALGHPLGTRYHALHHLAPSLPYHALGHAHRELVSRGVLNTIYGRTYARRLLDAVFAPRGH
jgi:fatty acid desaturase